MTPEDFQRMQQAMQFIVEQQAAFTTDIQLLREVQAADAQRITRLEGAVTNLMETVQTLAQVAQAHSDRMDSTDERLDRLIATVDRYVTARGSNGSNGNPAAE